MVLNDPTSLKRCLWGFFTGIMVGFAVGVLVAVGVFNPRGTPASGPGNSSVETGTGQYLPGPTGLGSELFSPDSESREREAADADVAEARRRTDDFLNHLRAGHCSSD